MTTSAELYHQARQIETLADEVEVCLDAARQAASSSDWEGPNADDVRLGIEGWRSAASTAAGSLRTEAGVRRARAAVLAEEERELREAGLERV